MARSLPRVDDVMAQTPVDRDRWADALRAGSLLVVMAGHWLMVSVTPDGSITNTLSVIPALQPLTWVLQVMPLFFLVGGVAHSHSLDSLAASAHPEVAGGASYGRYAAFVRARALRLLRPSGAFLAVWVALGVVAHLAGWTSGPGGRLFVAALVLVPQLLWFVGIYLGVAALAPVMRRLHKRYGWSVVVVLVAGAAVADLARFAGGVESVGLANFALVWLALHQVGFAWRDGAVTTRIAGLLLGAGVASLVLGVTLGPYPVSMVGLPGEPVSNMSPPTLALLSQGLAIIGAAALLRGPMGALLLRPRVWRAVLMAGPFAMTAFLWHLTALMVAIVAARALGVTLPSPGSATWWVTRPLWFLLLAGLTTALVRVFVRWDRGSRRAMGGDADPRRWVDPVAATGAGTTVVGVLMVSIVGVDVLGNRPVFFVMGEVTPAVAFAVFLAGCLLLYVARPRLGVPVDRRGPGDDTS
ncbi:MAG TPA: acyltransferase [Candidatus Lustribacter sp.]|nr:acyltransferase [Candidatus Lustribacter sp.]